jgi:hypothetical protein
LQSLDFSNGVLFLTECTIVSLDRYIVIQLLLLRLSIGLSPLLGDC